MPQGAIYKIRNAVKTENYDMTYHAIEEMAEDGLNIFDIENAMLNGKIIKIDKNDPRGAKFILKGMADNKSDLIGIVGRFKETGTFLIITVYKIC